MDENQNYLARSRTSMITRDKWKASVKEGWTPTPVNKDDQRPARHHLRHQIRRQTKQETTQVCQETNEGNPKETKGDKGPRKRTQPSLGDKWKETKEDKRPSRTDTPTSNHRSPGGFKGMGNAEYRWWDHYTSTISFPVEQGAPAPAPFGRSCHVFGRYSCNCIVIPEAQRTYTSLSIVWLCAWSQGATIFSLQISGSSLRHMWKRLRRTCEYVGTYRDFLICPASSCHKSFHSYVHKSLAHMYVICPSKRARFTFSEVLQVRLACSLVAELAGPPETYCWHVLLASTEMVPRAIKYFRCAHKYANQSLRFSPSWSDPRVVPARSRDIRHTAYSRGAIEKCAKHLGFDILHHLFAALPIQVENVCLILLLSFENWKCFEFTKTLIFTICFAFS